MAWALLSIELNGYVAVSILSNSYNVPRFITPKTIHMKPLFGKYEPYGYGDNLHHDIFVDLVKKKIISFKLADYPQEGLYCSYPSTNYSKANKKMIKEGMLSEHNYYLSILKNGVVMIKKNTPLDKLLITIHANVIADILLVLSLGSVICLSLWGSFKQPLLLATFSVLAFIISSIFYRYQGRKKEVSKNAIGLIATIATLYSIVMLYESKSLISSAQSYFIEGEIKTKPVYNEPDEGAGYWELEKTFHPKSKKDKDKSELIAFGLLALVLTPAFGNIYYWKEIAKDNE